MRCCLRETYAPGEVVVVINTVGLESVHGSIIRRFAAVVSSYDEWSADCHMGIQVIFVPVPQESIRAILSLRFGCLARCWKIPSAIGERQMLPRQTKRMDIWSGILSCLAVTAT